MPEKDAGSVPPTATAAALRAADAAAAAAVVSKQPATTPSSQITAQPLGEEGRTRALGGWRKPYAIPKDFPDTAAVLGCIPKHCFEKPLGTSLAYAAFSVALTLALPLLAWRLLPAPAFTPLSIFCWTLYAFWEGAVATGCWVIAHECGHNAFCENKILQDLIGFVFHSALLVPYFSWQRSHAVHHSRTNHMSEGETHVPQEAATDGKSKVDLFEWIGEDAFAVINLFNHLVLGWPVYLLTGATGSPKRGFSNHFVPTNDALFPGEWKIKVLLSDVGILSTIATLVYWARVAGSTQVLVLYFAPYLFVNMWLVLYTWLQHTDVDVPHFDDSNWTWLKGAFMTIDRPYPQPFDFLHHKIGSTHVAHHVCSRIPHYHAREATEAIKKSFPQYYLYDPTPILPTLWRVAAKCVATVPEGDCHYYTHPAK